MTDKNLSKTTIEEVRAPPQRQTTDRPISKFKHVAGMRRSPKSSPQSSVTSMAESPRNIEFEQVLKT